MAKAWWNIFSGRKSDTAGFAKTTSRPEATYLTETPEWVTLGIAVNPRCPKCGQTWPCQRNVTIVEIEEFGKAVTRKIESSYSFDCFDMKRVKHGS